jgi:ABC-type bacteriocin/lantibiotic exporter with double-glycine peptidase domain
VHDAEYDLTAVSWYGAVQVLHGDLSTGLLTSFMIYALTLAMAFAFLS